jgi:ABC-type transport system involved in multi-copper enzyme maturation permease subunit
VTVLTMAGLTLREALRRKVIWALLGLTAVLLGLDAWGFASLPGTRTSFGSLTSGEARLMASELLNLVMFALSLIVALGAAFLAGPTLSGELESGVALAVLARPVDRWAVLLGKWLGLSLFACGYVVTAGLAQFAVVWWTVGYWPPRPVSALALISLEAVTLLTLGLLLSSLISPMASGVVAVGLFGSTWVAGVVGGVGDALGNAGVARVGTVAHVVLPTDGLWRAAMNALQDPSMITQFPQATRGFPFLSASGLSAGYLTWVVLWLALVGGVCALTFARRDV